MADPYAGYGNDGYNQRDQWTYEDGFHASRPQDILNTNGGLRPSSDYVRIDEFEDRFHYTYSIKYLPVNIIDSRLIGLNYRVESDVTPLFENRAKYQEVAETRAITEYVQEINWITEPIIEPRTIYDYNVVHENTTEVNYGIFSEDSLRAITGDIRIEAGNNINVSGIIAALGDDGEVIIEAGQNLIVNGELPEGASPEDTIPATAVVKANRAINILTGGDVTIAPFGALGEKTETSLYPTDQITISAGLDARIQGKLYSDNQVTLRADENIELNGQITAGNLIDIQAGKGSEQTGHITGDLNGILSVENPGSDILLTAGSLVGNITLDNTDFRAQDQVQIQVPNGSLQHWGGREGIVASQLSVTTHSGIAANTAIDSADLVVNGTGDISLTEKDDLTLTLVNAVDGSINITSLSDVAAIDLFASSNITLNLIDLSGNDSSDLLFDRIETNSTGTVTLHVEGKIEGLNPTHILRTGHANISSTRNVDITTEIETLTLKLIEEGNVTISEFDEIVLDDIGVANGSFALTADGKITVNQMALYENTVGQEIQLSNTSGNILVDRIDAGLGKLTIDAAGSLAEIGTGDQDADLLANQARLIANSGIGSIETAINTLEEVRLDSSGSVVINNLNIAKKETGLVLLNVLISDGSLNISSQGSIFVGYPDVNGNAVEGKIVVQGIGATASLTSTPSNIVVAGREDDTATIEAYAGIILAAAHDITLQGKVSAAERLEFNAGNTFSTSDRQLSLNADTIIIESGTSIFVDGTLSASELLKIVTNNGNITITGAIQAKDVDGLTELMLIAYGNRIQEGDLTGFYEFQANGKSYYKDNPRIGVGNVFERAGDTLIQVANPESLELRPVIHPTYQDVKDEQTGLSLYEDDHGKIFYRDISINKYYRWLQTNDLYSFQGVNYQTGDIELFYST
ncbi:MAG: hypothetical protein MJE63_23060, partial [Proteobacteria bacterium]|nr:hypothetical protein [Pseudomonadota bacterium]